MTWTPTILNIKDASGITQPIIAYTDGTNFSFANPILDNTGAIIAPATSGNQTTANTSLATIATAVQAATPAGTNVIGAVTSPGIVHKNPTVVVTAGAYSSGYVVGGLLAITNALRVSGGSGAIQSVVVNVKTALTAPYDVFFFDQNPINGTYTDNVAYAENTADSPFCFGVAHCNDPVSCGVPQRLQAININLPFVNGSSNTTLYAVIVIRGAQTFASTSAVQLSVIIAQN